MISGILQLLMGLASFQGMAYGAPSLEGKQRLKYARLESSHHDPEAAYARMSKSQYRENYQVFFGILSTPLTPSEYRIPKYDLDQQILRSGSLWTSDLRIRSSKAGVYGGMEFLMVDPWSLRTNIKFRFPFEDSLDTDYNAADTSIYSNVTTKSTSYGVSFDGVYRAWSNDWFNLAATGGLYFDESLVRVKITKKSETDPQSIATLNSDLLSVSTQLGGLVSVPFKNGGIGFHSLILFPFFGEAQASGARPTLSPEVSNDQRVNSSKDLEKALGHRKTKLGVELGLNTYYTW